MQSITAFQPHLQPWKESSVLLGTLSIPGAVDLQTDSLVEQMVLSKCSADLLP